jgi:hypothetical protein
MPRAKGSPRTPPLSAKARKVREEIFTSIFQINVELKDLSEEELKAVVSDMRRFLESDRDHIQLGIVAAAEHQLAILERHRIGDGKWFAVVEAFEAEEMRLLARAECDSKSAAETEVQRLMAEHASKAGENIEIESRVLCDLEMDPYYYDPIP